MQISPLRMPLNADSEMGFGIKLDGFDDAVADRYSAYEQVVADNFDCLVVARVDQHVERARREQSCKS